MRRDRHHSAPSALPSSMSSQASMRSATSRGAITPSSAAKSWLVISAGQMKEGGEGGM